MAQDSVDVNISSYNGCTALASRGQLTKSQIMSSERHFGLDESRLIDKGMQETLSNSIKSVGVPWASVRIEEPDTHARNYLEENHILRTLEVIEFLKLPRGTCNVCLRHTSLLVVSGQFEVVLFISTTVNNCTQLFSIMCNISSLLIL